MNGKFPSGWNDDDLDNHILDGMWRLLNNSPAVEVADDNNGDDDDDDDDAANQAPPSTPECPQDWI